VGNEKNAPRAAEPFQAPRVEKTRNMDQPTAPLRDEAHFSLLPIPGLDVPHMASLSQSVKVVP